MKHTTKYIFAGIMSAIIGTAHATGENIIAAKSYVDTQDALKQDLIDAEMMERTYGKGAKVYLPTLVSYDDTLGINGTQYGIVTETINMQALTGVEAQVIPTLSLVNSKVSLKQDKIPASGYSQNGSAYNTDVASTPFSWLNTAVKGTGLITRTSNDGEVGERSIFEAVDVPAYHDDKLTQTEKDIQDISIPTVGAMMSAISSGITAAAPTGTANTIANYDEKGTLGTGIATYDGSGTYNAATDAGKIATAAAVETKANHMTCAGWPDGVAHTDENCWLWNKN